MRPNVYRGTGRELVFHRINLRILFLIMLAFVLASCGLVPGPQYERMIGGFIHASLQAIIVGELAGRKQSQAYPSAQVPVCRPSDFVDLSAAAKDETAFDAFYRRCRFVEVKKTENHIVGTAYLPSGHCEALKQAYDKMLAEHVNAPTVEDRMDMVEFEYKGSRFMSTGSRRMARSAQLRTKCSDDGSLSISALRKRPRT